LLRTAALKAAPIRRWAIASECELSCEVVPESLVEGKITHEETTTDVNNLRNAQTGFVNPLLFDAVARVHFFWTPSFKKPFLLASRAKHLLRGRRRQREFRIGGAAESGWRLPGRAFECGGHSGFWTWVG